MGGKLPGRWRAQKTHGQSLFCQTLYESRLVVFGDITDIQSSVLSFVVVKVRIDVGGVEYQSAAVGIVTFADLAHTLSDSYREYAADPEEVPDHILQR